MGVAECVQVSEEMQAVIGGGAPAGRTPPADPVRFLFDLSNGHALRIREADARADEEAEVTLIVARAACARVFGAAPGAGDFHLPAELRAIAHAMLHCAYRAEPRTTYRRAKALELLCEAVRLLQSEALVPMRGGGVVPLADARRLFAARRLIEERWQEKLTLDRIARACGLNRVKLTRGFREMFDCTVAVAIAERRLDAACRLLRTTDRPVSAIGFESGYQNNASFARAFARRFGVSPSEYRARKLAA